MKNNQAISNCKNCENCKKKEKEQLPVEQINCDHDWEDISKMDDLERQLICTYCSMKKSEPFELNKHRWSQEDEDSCVDIANHISPLTKVIEK